MRWDDTDTVMKLETEDTVQRYIEAGLWHDRTLDAGFAHLAETRGDRMAIADAPDRWRWTGGTVWSLSFADLDEAISRAATAFQAVGLEPGAVVAIQSPATTDALISVFGAWRAGLIVCQVPLVWRKRDIIPVLRQVSARAIIVADRYRDEQLALEMREVAAEIFAVRYLFGIGDNLPDGLIDLPGLCGEVEPSLREPQADANAVATVSVVHGGDGKRILIPRTHNHWLAAMHHCRQVCQQYPGAVLSTFDPSAYAGNIVGTLMPLLTGNTVLLHRYKGPAAFVRTVEEHSPAIAVIPGALAGALCSALDEANGHHTTLAAISSEGNDAECPVERERAIIDVTSIADLAVYATVRRASSEHRETLPIGAIGSCANGAVLLQSRIRARVHKASTSVSLLGGELQVRGAMVPTQDWPRGNEQDFAALPSGGDAYVSTDIACNLSDGETNNARLMGRVSETATVGTQAISAVALEALYAEVGTVSDAAVRFDTHPLYGVRVTAIVVPAEGSLVDLSSFCDQLRALGAPRHVLPEEIVSVPVIPRDNDGQVDHDLLAGAMSRGAGSLVA